MTLHFRLLGQYPKTLLPGDPLQEPLSASGPMEERLAAVIWRRAGRHAS